MATQDELMQTSLGYIMLDLTSYKLYLSTEMNSQNPIVSFGTNTYLLSDEDNKFYITNKHSQVLEHTNQFKVLKELKGLINNPLVSTSKQCIIDSVQVAWVPVTQNAVKINDIKYSVITNEYYYIKSIDKNRTEFKICKLIQDTENILVENLTLIDAAGKFNEIITKEIDKTAQVICHLVI